MRIKQASPLTPLQRRGEQERKETNGTATIDLIERHIQRQGVTGYADNMTPENGDTV